MAKRVRWTEEEKHKIIDAVFSMRQNDPESPIHHLINKVQSQLPADRRRKIMTSSTVPWLADEIRVKFRDQRRNLQRLETMKERMKNVDKEIEKATEQSEQQIDHRKKELDKLYEDKKKRLEEMEVELPNVDDIRREAIDNMNKMDLLIEFIRRWDMDSSTIHNRLGHIEEFIYKLGKIEPEQQERIAPAPTKKKPVKRPKKILVIGLLPGQEREIYEEFKTRLKIVFMDKNKSRATMVSSYPTCDRCFISARFVSHQIITTASKKYGKDIVENLAGGISDFKNSINSYLNGN